jgi:hypothetical protein
MLNLKTNKMFGHVGNKLVLLGETIDMCDELPSMT